MRDELEPMSENAALVELRRCQASGDTEAAHSDADTALCRFLLHLGYHNIVSEWERVDKWYA